MQGMSVFVKQLNFNIYTRAKTFTAVTLSVAKGLKILRYAQNDTCGSCAQNDTCESYAQNDTCGSYAQNLMS